ncbi:cytochrome c oxidase subunit NDUFA4-like [Hydractinia symbiolongicarpus]|uniref:cytochrome c oxidase subunit NDUFA4-like n=1 Tax=Hydractinia symbiolongicarpus TaxID=13093 RepID=UPI00254BF0B3|nr:cytochrome c oxidase subunit NDUFA4-like [Hydractinia symbiolongicarpus]
MQFSKHLKQPELAPLFGCTGIGMMMAGLYVLRLATKGPEVTWSRVKNPEPWQVIGPTQRIKLFSHTDYSKFSRPAPQEAYDAVKMA